jgi:hypothetical protein
LLQTGTASAKTAMAARTAAKWMRCKNLLDAAIRERSLRLGRGRLLLLLHHLLFSLFEHALHVTDHLLRFLILIGRRITFGRS